MKAAKALIAWTPTYLTDQRTRGQVRIGPLLEEGDTDWTRPYAMTGGASEVRRRKLKDWEAVAFVFIEFNTLVVRDGIDPEVAHKAFLAIDEYANRISPDIPGARDQTEAIA